MDSFAFHQYNTIYCELLCLYVILSTTFARAFSTWLNNIASGAVIDKTMVAKSLEIVYYIRNRAHEIQEKNQHKNEILLERKNDRDKIETETKTKPKSRFVQ